MRTHILDLTERYNRVEELNSNLLSRIYELEDEEGRDHDSLDTRYEETYNPSKGGNSHTGRADLHSKEGISQRQHTNCQPEQNNFSTESDIRSSWSTDATIAEKDRIIAELREENGNQRETIERLYATIHRHEDKDVWINKLFGNKKIPTACKLVLWQYFMIVSFMRPNLTDELQIRMDKVAENLGIDSATVRRATDKAETAGILARRYETVEQDGETRKYVYIALGEEMAHPQYLAMEKTHGGKRVKRCSNCGTEDIDRYTVQYCRCCDKNDWYMQPTTRNDAPWEKAQKAENRAVYGKGKTAAPDDATEKQDAFAPDPIIEVSNRIENAIDQADRKMKTISDQARNISSQAPEKQDALEIPAQLVTEHTHRDRSKMQDAFQVWGNVEIKTCHAEFQLNKKGQLAHKLEPVVSTRICGSSRWQWSEEDNCQICEECWTPQPIEEEKQ